MHIKNNIVTRHSAKSIQKISLIAAALFVTITILNYFSLTNLPNGLLLFSTVLFGFMVILLLYTSRNIPDTRSLLALAIFSGIMAASVVIGDKISTNTLTAISLTRSDPPYWLAWLVVIFSMSNWVFIQAQKCKCRPLKDGRVSGAIWLKSSLIIFALWTPYFLAFFPGILNSDTSDQLNQALGGAGLNNHHPVLIAGFISLFAHLGLLISDNYYVAIALVTLAQMTVSAIVLGYVSSWLIARFNIPKLELLTVVFFGIFPVVPYFIVTIGKDTLFALSVILFAVKIYDFVVSRGASLQKWMGFMTFSLVALLVIFTRNNGIYLVFLCLFTMAIVYRQLWRRTIPAFLLIIGVSLLIHGPLFGALRIPLSKSTESFGTLIQQIGRTVALEGDLSEDDKKAISPILPVEKWSKYYNPATPDRLKFCYTDADACMDNEYLDKHKMDFLRAWASIGLKNPRIYLEALLTQNSGFWHIGSPDDYGSFRSDEKKYTSGSVDVFREVAGIHAVGVILKSMQAIRDSPLGMLINQGSLIWIVLFAGTVLIIRRHYTMLLSLLPATSLWLSLMAAAPAMSFRYSLATFLMLPIILVITAAYSGPIKKSSS